MSDRTTRSALIDINMLPRERRPAEISARAMLGVAAVAIVLLAIVPLSLTAQHARALARDAQSQAREADDELSGLQVDLTRVRALRAEISAADTERTALEAELHALQGGSHPLGDGLGALWAPGTLGERMRITKVAGIDGGLSVEGAAASPLDAIAYAASLAAEGRFASARMTSYAPAAEGGRFTVEVTR